MLGVPVVAEPRCVSYHLSAGRGYAYHNDDFIFNTFLGALSLGADDWAERVKINNLRHGRKEVVEHLWELAYEKSREERRWFERWRKKKGPVLSFNEMLIQRPWSELNKKKHGFSNDNLLIYHPTWLNLIKGTPAEKAYNNSTYQKGLDEFIRKNLWDFVYHNNEFDKNNAYFPTL